MSRDVEDTMKSTKSAPVSHAHHNILNASLGSRLDELSESSCACVEALTSVSSVLTKFGAEEIHKGLVFGQSPQSRELFFFGGFISP